MPPRIPLITVRIASACDLPFFCLPKTGKLKNLSHQKNASHTQNPRASVLAPSAR
jgi:hypothetical protein